MHTAGEVDDGLVTGFLVAELVALEFGVDVVSAEGGEHAVEDRAGVAAGEGSGEGTVFVAGETDEAVGVGGKFFGCRGGGFVFADAEFG
jgi:hypothetical protein